MTPVARPQIQHAAGDEGERDRVGTGHPLAMLHDLAIAGGDDGSRGADHPGSRLHRGSWQSGASGGKSDPGEGANKDRDDIEAAKHSMELQVSLANARRELQR